MRLVGLEEHFVTADLVEAWRALEPRWRDLALKTSSEGEIAGRLEDLGDGRIAAMDEAGLDVQVVSMAAPGVQNLPTDAAVAIQTTSNDLLADAIRAHPDRLQGLATLATPAPAEAARELERAVTTLGMNGGMLFGRTRERHLDHPDFWPIFEAAAALNAPLYLHPQSPLPAVRDAYYSGLGETLDAPFATYGLGWHYETGVGLIRLILAGVFDRFPNLQVIVGHWGEVVMFYLERIEPLALAAKLDRPLWEYFRNNVFVTPSGVLSQRYLRWAIEVVGVDRILFSTDYPYIPAPHVGHQFFLLESELRETDRVKIASGNWDRLCAGIRRPAGQRSVVTSCPAEGVA